MAKKSKPRDKSVFREYFELIAETAVFVFFVMTFVVQAFQIPTGSMEPTLMVGDFLLVNKMANSRPRNGLEDALLPGRAIERKDIVVFKNPQNLKQDYVKRIIALEGEKIEIRDKQVYINGFPFNEDYKVHTDSHVYSRNDSYHYDELIRDNFGPVAVPPGHCFVTGDNRDNSLDSRDPEFGFVDVKDIVGQPVMLLWARDKGRIGRQIK